MMNHRPLFVAFVALFALSSSPVLPVRARSMSGVTLDRSADWREIMQLWDKGKPLITKGLSDSYEDKDVWTQQVHIFSQAAPKLDSWIDKYVTDKNSLEYLKNVYRLGNYWEYSGNWVKAQASYKICSRHPLLDAPGATYGGKPLKQLVEERLTKTALALKKRRVAWPGWIFVQYGSSQALHTEPDLDAVFPPQPLDEPLD